MAAIMLVALALALAGCAAAGGSGTSPASPASSASPGGGRADRLPAAVTIDRVGGFAGIRQRITVQPTGDWTLVGPPGTSRTGTLPPDRRAALRQLLTGTAWWAGREASTPPCSDGYSYLVTSGAHTASANDCSLGGLPGLREIVRLIVGATSR